MYDSRITKRTCMWDSCVDGTDWKLYLLLISDKVIPFYFICLYLSPVSSSGQDSHDLTSFVCKKYKTQMTQNRYYLLITLVVPGAIIISHCWNKLEITLSHWYCTRAVITDLPGALLRLIFKSNVKYLSECHNSNQMSVTI